MKQRCGAGPMGGGRRLDRLLLCSWMVLCFTLLQGNAVVNASPVLGGPPPPLKDNATVNATPFFGVSTNVTTSKLGNYVTESTPEPDRFGYSNIEHSAKPESAAQPKTKSTAETKSATKPKADPTADPGANPANVKDVATSTVPEPEATVQPTLIGRHSRWTTVDSRIPTDGGGNKSTDSIFPETVKPSSSDKNESKEPGTDSTLPEPSKADVVSVISNIKIINSSIQLEESAEYGPNKAIDNNTETYWNITGTLSNEVYITFELTEIYTVSSINLLNFENYTNNITEVKLKASDDNVTWGTEKKISTTVDVNATETSKLQTFDGFTATGKFLRLTITTTYGACLSEIRFIGYAGVATTTPIPATTPATTPAVPIATDTLLTTVKTVVSVVSIAKIINSSSSLEKSAEYGPEKVIDNNNKTYWNITGTLSTEVYITFELTEIYTVSSINLLNFENDTYDIAEVKLKASDDNVTWGIEKILNSYDENATETSEWQTFDGFTATGKFLRLTLTDTPEICLSEIRFIGYAEAATTTPSPATIPAVPIVTNTTQTPVIKPLKPGTDLTDITVIDPYYIDTTTDYIKPGAGSGPTEVVPPGGKISPSPGTTSPGTPGAVKWVLSILVCCVLLGVGALAYNTYFKPIKRCISEERLLEVKAPESLSVERPVDKSDLQDTVRRLLEQGSQKLADEYRELRTVSPIRYTENASLETNRHKNRYINILPFDDSRVELQELQGMVCSDYINASYIHEYSQPKLFIACQGPMKDTLGTFWRMIWEKNVHIIVMVTQCVESNKDKCQKYWPEAYDNDGLVNRNDNIKIITTSEENHGAYTIRRFKVSQNFRQREVRHFHYTAWPDMGCPDTPDQLINFVTTVREAHRTLQTPANSHQHLVVHCSAGVGRTGTFIGLWNLMSEIQEPKPTVDVFKTVFNMRYMRCNMVQTQIQYSFLYKCILRHYMQLNGLGDAIFVEDNRGGRPTTPDIVSSVRPNTMKSFQNSNAKLHGSSCDVKGETDTDIMEFSSSSESNNGKDEDNIDGKEESIASDDKRPSSSMYPNIDEIATAVCNEEEIPAEYTTTFGINENTDIAEKKV